MIFIRFDRDKIAAKFFRSDRTSTAAGEWVEDEVTRIRAGKDDLREELFGFLSWMVCVFGHRPKWDGNVRPDVRRMRVAKIPFGRFVPILWLSILAIGSDHAAALLHCIEIERKFI